MKFATEAQLNEKFLENMHDAVLVLDEDYNIVAVNHVAILLYGYTAAEFKKLNLRDIRALSERGKIAYQMRGVTLQEGGIWETIHVRKNGVNFPVEVSSSPIDVGGKKHFYHVVRDISERKKEEAALRASQERYKQVVEFLPDAVFIHSDEKIVFMNRAGFKLFGATSPEQIIGQSLFILYPPERHGIVRVRNKLMLETRQAVPTIEHTVLRLDGTRLNVEATAIFVDYEGKPSYLVTMRDVTERKKYERELAFLAKHDPITGLSNRTFFQEILSYEITKAKENEKKLVVIFIDIDDFSIFNQVLGHSGGDELLKLIAASLVTLNIPRENLARFGPQFAAILNNISDADQALTFIDKINAAIDQEFTVQDQIINVRFNYGVVIYPDDGEQVATLLSGASVALASAKETGGGAVQFCTVELQLLAQKRIKMEKDLKEALNKNEFFLLYQPIVDANTMTTVGFESLIRWRKDGQLINPNEFISIAERTHLIISIGEWIARTACAQAQEWQSIAPNIFISINISPIQFRHGHVLEMLTKILAETGLNPKFLKIEVTESALMEDTAKSINMLKEIKQMGIKISIDDFGTGYSSLNYLRHLPVDFLKIDQSFVRNMTTETNDAAIVKTIIDLAHNLNYGVIAEGVETRQQLSFLSTLGCYNIQGYYFSAPLPVAEATEFLRQGKLLR